MAREVDLERFFVSGGGSDVEEVWKPPGERLIVLNRQKGDRAKSSVLVRRRGRSGRDRRFSAVADRGRIGRMRHRARSGSARSGRAAATALRCGWCELAVVGRWCSVDGCASPAVRRGRCEPAVAECGWCASVAMRVWMGASVVARARERRYVRVGGGTIADDVVSLGRDLADQPGATFSTGFPARPPWRRRRRRWRSAARLRRLWRNCKPWETT